MDQFSDVFDTKPKVDKEGNPIKAAPEEALNFTKQIPKQDAFDKTYSQASFADANDEAFQAMANKVLKDGDANALAELLNSHGQKVASASVSHALRGTGQLLDSNLDTIQNQTGNKVSDGIRVAGLHGQLVGKHPQLANLPAGTLEAAVEKFTTTRGDKLDADLLKDISDWAVHAFNLPTEAQAQQTSEQQAKDADEDWSQMI